MKNQKFFKKFSEWLEIRENATTTSDVAGFARNIFGTQVRRIPEKGLTLKKKKPKMTPG